MAPPQPIRLVIPTGRMYEAVRGLLADAGLTIPKTAKNYRPVAGDPRFGTGPARKQHEDALETIVEFEPELVITDLRMDGMDGAGLLDEIQLRWPGPY